MTNVHLVTEDRTGGGLALFLRAAAEHLRQQQGRARLEFSRKPSTVNGNAELLKQCANYERFRFDYRPCYEHVFYVMDARNAWDLPQLGVQAPSSPYRDNLPGFMKAIRLKLEHLAQNERTPEQWAKIRGGFHAHVLVWERESLILPVADKLGLGEAVPDVYAERRAAEAVTHKFRHSGLKRKYDKAIDGPEYLKRIAQNEQLRATVLASNPSLQAIVDDLASL